MSYPSIIKKIKSKKLKFLVLGDFMLDHYQYGDIHRLSPEAPIPVVNYRNESFNLGGAGNVLHNLYNLGIHTYPIGLIGDDESGKIINSLINEIKSGNDLIISKTNQTIQKTRIIGNQQQIVRIDRDTSYIENSDIIKIIDSIKNTVRNMDAVIVSDYAKGVCNEEIVNEVILHSKKYDIPVFVDPKGENYIKYKNATCITPNLIEAEKIFSKKLKNKKSYFSACNFIMKKFEIESCITTLGEYGLAYVDRNNKFYIDAIKKEVFDVSGAGDTVISAFSSALLSGVNLYDALNFSNYAASTVITHHGTYPINIDEIKNES